MSVIDLPKIIRPSNPAEVAPVVTQAWPQRWRWTGADYDEIVNTGLFEGQRVELVEGDIFKMSPMNDPHAQAIRLVDYSLRPLFSSNETTFQHSMPLTTW